jgi:hypothetical protein
LTSGDHLSPKRPKLSFVGPPTNPTASVVVTGGKMLFTGGGIVSLSKIGAGHNNQAGLLQVPTYKTVFTRQ